MATRRKCVDIHGSLTLSQRFVVSVDDEILLTDQKSVTLSYAKLRIKLSLEALVSVASELNSLL